MSKPLKHTMARKIHGKSTSMMILDALHRDVKIRAATEGNTVSETANQAMAIGLGRFDLLPEVHPLYRPAVEPEVVA